MDYVQLIQLSIVIIILVNIDQIISKCAVTDNNQYCGQQLITSSNNVVHKVNNRIIDGSIANQYRPFMVSIFRNKNFLGGGVIVGQRWIVTAAHLFKPDINVEEFRVGFGSNYLYKQKIITITRIFKHERFERKSLQADIALVKTRESLLYENRTDFIYLPFPKNRNPIKSDRLIVVGWGDVQYKLINEKRELLEASMKVVKRYDCAKRYLNPIDETHICAISKNSSIKSRTCQGDSGGPLYEIIKQQPILVGIASWTADECYPSYPNVFTKVSFYLEWICNILTVNNS